MTRYTVYVTADAFDEVKHLPGNVRQWVRKSIGELADDPRPSASRMLEVPDLEHELRRIRLNKWRIVYAIAETEKAVDVLAVRRRPPYDYGDLGTLIESL